MLLGLLLTACVEQYNIIVEPVSLEKHDKILLVNASIHTNDEMLTILHNKASRSFVCHNARNNRIDSYISSFNYNKLTAELSLCENLDNELCVAKQITLPINWQCQLIFSDMLGSVIKSKKFDIVYD